MGIGPGDADRPRLKGEPRKGGLLMWAIIDPN